MTGEGMNSGWLFEDDHDTVKYERDVLRILKDRAHNYDLKVEGRSDDDIMQAAFELDICYWTEWEDEIGPDDECYTLNGIPLVDEWQRKAYLNHQPCTIHEVCAVVLAAQSYTVWLDEGEVNGKWTGIQKVIIGGVWDNNHADSTAVAMHDDEVLEYYKMYRDHRLHTSTIERMNELIKTPDVWRFIGWEDIYKEHGPITKAA